jgi:hypothetical protein
MTSFPDLSNWFLQQLLEKISQGAGLFGSWAEYLGSGLSAPWPDNPAWDFSAQVFSILLLSI